MVVLYKAVSFNDGQIIEEVIHGLTRNKQIVAAVVTASKEATKACSSMGFLFLASRIKDNLQSNEQQ